MDHTLHTEQWIERPLNDVFDFFSQASNLELITPKELSFKILNPEPIVIREGSIIDYQLRLAGIPFSWKTEITRWNPPFDFEDTQLKGPYSMWIHTHRFEQVDGKTRISDEVQYRLPLSPISEIVHPLIRAQLRRIFAFRQKAVERFFEKQDSPSSRSPTVDSSEAEKRPLVAGARL